MSDPNVPGEPPLDRIRKLLAMAERGATEAERDAFNAKAMELLERYGLDRARLAAEDPTTDVIGDRAVNIPAPFALDKVWLLWRVANGLGVKVVWHGNHAYGGHIRAEMFGFGADLERVELLFTSLLVQAMTGVNRLDIPYWLRGTQIAAFKRSWLDGYGRAVRRRLREATERARQADAAEHDGDTSMALVLVSRAEQVARRVKEVYPDVKSRRRSLAGDGRDEGYQAGLTADIGTTRVGGRARPAIPAQRKD